MKYAFQRGAILALGGLLLTGCAGVTFYSNSGLTEKTGIPIPKPGHPYLLVVHTGATDKPIEASVVYISNPTEVIYAVPRSGFGSSDLNMTLANGQLTTFGQKTDPKIDELITSIGGLLTSRATAIKTIAEAAATSKGTGTSQGAVPDTEIGQAAKSIADEMGNKLKDSSFTDGLESNESNAVKSARQVLTTAGSALANPANTATSQQQKDSIKAQASALAALPTTSKTKGTKGNASLKVVHEWADRLNALFLNTPAQPDKNPSFELYEISPGNTNPLKQVYP